MAPTYGATPGYFAASTVHQPWDQSEVPVQHGLTHEVLRRALRDEGGIAESVERLVDNRAADLSPTLAARINRLSRLPENWDSEGAKPIKKHVLADVIYLIKRISQEPGYEEPFLAPTFGGFVQLEWHAETRSLEIEAVSEGWEVAGTWVSSIDRQRHYEDSQCASDFRKLQTFYRWFTGAERIWPSQ